MAYSKVLYIVIIMVLRRSPRAVFLLVIAFGCTYEPEETFFEEIERDNAEYAVLLNEYSSMDTITIHASTTFNYNLHLSQGSLESLSVLLDGQIIHNSNWPKGRFVIDGPLLKTGTYELKVQFVATSGTGSMADREGLEKVQVWRDWVLVIYADIPEPPVVQTYLEDGYQVVSWNPYTGKYFLDYSLTVYYEQGPPMTITLRDPSVTHWVDRSYVGGVTTGYGVAVRNRVGTSIWGRTIANFDFEPIATFNPQDSVITLNWKATPFVGPFGDYTIEAEGKQLITITDPAKSSFTFKPATIGFNYTSTITFSCKPKNATANAGTVIHLDVLQEIGSRMKWNVSQIYFNETVGIIVGYSARSGVGWLHKFNAEMEAVDSTSFDILSHSVPFRGSFAYYPDKPNVMKLDLQTFEPSAVVAISGLTPFLSGPNSITGAANGIVSYGFLGPKPDGPLGVEFYGRVFDPVGNDFRYSGSITPRISEDAEFMKLADNSYYKFNGSSYVLIGSLTDEEFLFFRQDIPGEFACTKGTASKLLIHDAGDLSLKRTITAPAGLFTSYDPVTRKAIFCDSGSRYVYAVDIDTGTATSINAVTERYNQFTMTNGILFSDDGTYIKVYQ